MLDPYQTGKAAVEDLRSDKTSLISERILEKIGFDPGSFIWTAWKRKACKKKYAKICKWENNENNDH